MTSYPCIFGALEGKAAWLGVTFTSSPANSPRKAKVFGLSPGESRKEPSPGFMRALRWAKTSGMHGRGYLHCAAASHRHKSQRIQILKSCLEFTLWFFWSPVLHQETCGIFCVAHLDLNFPLTVSPRLNSKLCTWPSLSFVMIRYFMELMCNIISLFSRCAQELVEPLISLTCPSLTLEDFCSRVRWEVASGSAANNSCRAQISFRHCKNNSPSPYLFQVWRLLKSCCFYLATWINRQSYCRGSLSCILGIKQQVGTDWFKLAYLKVSWKEAVVLSVLAVCCATSLVLGSDSFGKKVGFCFVVGCVWFLVFCFFWEK